MNSVRPRWSFYTYLLVLSIFGIALVFINTSTYGPGISSDGLHYLSTADSLINGRGFTNFHGGVYILWPPLYPLILAGLSILTGLDTLIIGWILNAVAFGVTIFLSGVLLKTCFPDQPAWQALGAALVLFFMSYVVLASNIGSDQLFVVLVLGSFLACHRYMTTSNRGALWVLLILVALAPLQRFLGVCVVAVGALAVFIKHMKQPIKATVKAIAFGLVASLPTLVWVIGRNYRLYGSLTGPRQLHNALIIENIAYCTRQILRWFVPLSVIDRLPLWVLPALVLVVLLLFARKRHWASFFKRLSNSPQWIMITFSAIYLVIIVLTTITGDHLHPHDDRFQSVVFLPVLVLLFTVLQELIIAPLEERKLNLTRPVLVFLILVWSIYPVFTLWKYVQKSVQDGEAIYNLYNLRVYQESPVIRYLKEHPPEPGIPLYSNDSEAVYFFIRKPVELSPTDFVNNQRSEAYLLEHYQGWPNAEMAYLVWFVERGDRRYYYPPDELEEVAILEPLVESRKVGGVYLVRPLSR